MGLKKSIEEKKLAGTYRPSRDRIDWKESLEEVPPPPSYLSVKGKRLFQIICNDLNERQLLPQTAIHLVVMYCELYDEYLKCARVIRREGLTVKDGKAVRIHPVARIKKSVQEQMLALEKRLGLSPLTRDRLPGNDPAPVEEDILDKCSPGDIAKPREGWVNPIERLEAMGIKPRGST